MTTMPETRRSFRHLGEAQRRDDLIAAALELMAEGGPAAVTLRAVAARAGVTPGLIRHYFDGKEGLLAAAYDHLMAGMSGPGALAADTQPTPGETLAHFIRASLSPPVMDAGRMALWAGFIHMVRSNPDMRAIHRRTYLAYRDHLQALIGAALTAAGRPADTATLRRHAIACNAVLDGLWLEGSALPEAFEPDEIPRLGLQSVGALLTLDLTEQQ